MANVKISQLPEASAGTVLDTDTIVGVFNGITKKCKLSSINLDVLNDGTNYKRISATKATKINGGTFSEDDLADGTTYKRIQAAKANAINAGRDLGLTRYSLVPLYRPNEDAVMAIKNLGSGIILVGTQSSCSIIRSTNYGKSWVNVASTTGYSAFFAQNGANVISAVDASFRYYLSTDNGATWVGPIIPAGAGGAYAKGVWYLNGRWFISEIGRAHV